jgi:hypothetical protein
MQSPTDWRAKQITLAATRLSKSDVKLKTGSDGMPGSAVMLAIHSLRPVGADHE